MYYVVSFPLNSSDMTHLTNEKATQNPEGPVPARNPAKKEEKKEKNYAPYTLERVPHHKYHCRTTA